MPEKPKTVVDDLLKAAELGLIRVDEFRNIMKKTGWELTQPEENATAQESRWEYFYRDETGRLRFVPETPEQRAEHSIRVKLADSQAEKFPEEEKESVRKRLRKYRAEDLRDASIHSNTEEEIISGYGSLVAGYYDPQDKSIHILRGEEWCLDHEMAHFLTGKKFGTTDPAEYSKFLKGKYRVEIETYLGDSAVKDEGELIADAFSYMGNDPEWVRYTMRESAEVRELYNKVMNDLGYGTSGIRRGKR